MSREALVVGINRYPLLKETPTSKPRHLLKPAADAEAIAQYLETYGNFRVQRFPAIHQEGGWRVDPAPATRNLPKVTELEEAIARLFNPPSSVPDTALLFFAGHGLQKQQGGVTEGYLAASDVNPLQGKWGLSLNWLRQLLQNSPVRQQIVWLDCCHSGELLNFEEADPGAFGKNRDRCFIAASRGFEVAYEEVGGEHGVLTGALLQALNPEKHGEGWVTNYTLVDFINRQLATARQRPIFHNSGGEILLTGKQEQIERAVLMAGVCPYKGLEAFDFNEEDAKYFYGRTALIDSLLEKVREGNFLAVLGASGSGKSSAVKAGLLYQLKQGQKLSGSHTWPIYIFRPGEHPLENLARIFVENYNSSIEKELQLVKARELLEAGAFGLRELITATLAESEFQPSRLVLVADQFEESFTLCQDVSERQHFFECLLGVLELTENQLCLVLTMRADFFGKCAEQEYAGLSRLIQENLVAVTPMNREELEQAITEPAKKVGLEIQRELVEQILEDVEGAPGILPLLQYALTELWRRREVNRLTLAEYTKLGGVKGTLQKRADEVYSSLDETQQLIVKRIFLELTNLGEGTEDTRRQVLKGDLVTEQQSEAEVEGVLQQLANARLVVTSQLQARGESSQTVTAVDVAHEALIRHWGRLRAWVNENRQAIAIERRIEAAAEEWEIKKRSPDYLLVGLKLAEAQNYLENYSSLGLLSSLGKEFIQKSIDRRRNNRRLQVGTTVGVMGILCAAAVVSTIQWRNADKQTKIATLRQDAAVAQNLLNAEPVSALVLAIQATGKNFELLHEVMPAVQSSLRDAIDVSRESNLLEENTGVSSVAFSPDGKVIASGSGDGTVRLWDRSGKPLAAPFKGHTGSVNSVAFSPDGKVIASGSSDNTVRLWDRNGKQIAAPFQGHSQSVTSVAFSPDGKVIASASYDKTVLLWDRNGKQMAAPFQGHSSVVMSVVFSPDGKVIASGGTDNTVRLWDGNGKPVGTPFQGHSHVVNSVAFSSDGKVIASGSIDGTVRLWDRNGKPVGVPFQGHSDAVKSVAFSPDGHYIASASQDMTVRLWDCKSLAVPFQAHSDPVYSIAFSPDGKVLASAGDDKTVRLWDRNGKSVGSPFQGHADYVSSVAFSPDGKVIASGGGDKTVRLSDRNGKPVGTPFQGHTGYVSSVAFSPDGKVIASGSGDFTVRLWDRSGKPLAAPFKGHSDSVNSVAFSPDGKVIASGSGDFTVRLWDRNGKLLAAPFQGHSGYLTSVAFSPDGKVIASGSYDKTVRLWDRNGKPLAAPFQGHSDGVTSVAFSPDGKVIASGSYDMTVRLWDRNGNPLAAPFQGHSYGVSSVAFSPDGKVIASGSGDKTVRLWRGGDWTMWLSVGCDRLRSHPVLLNPETEEAKAAAQTCQKYAGWSAAEKAQFLVNRGRALAGDGDVSGALAAFKDALKLDAQLQLESETELKRLAARSLVEKGKKLAEEWELNEALAAYAKAQQLDPTVEMSAGSWNVICWLGSQRGRAADVMDACEKAAALDPNNALIRNMRGMARVLTGNTAGAIEDFEAYVKLTDSAEKKAERQRWIDDLRAGKQPFTSEEVPTLLNR